MCPAAPLEAKPLERIEHPPEEPAICGDLWSLLIHHLSVVNLEQKHVILGIFRMGIGVPIILSTGVPIFDPVCGCYSWNIHTDKKPTIDKVPGDVCDVSAPVAGEQLQGALFEGHKLLSICMSEINQIYQPVGWGEAGGGKNLQPFSGFGPSGHSVTIRPGWVSFPGTQP